MLTCLNRDGSTVLYLQASLLQRDSGWSADTSITWVSQDAQKHGFKDLTLQKLIQLRQLGILDSKADL